jgi:DNA-binding MarR family transcriptional regulator
VSASRTARLTRTANLLGALALAIVDRTSEAIADNGPGDSAAAALSALHHFLEGPSVELLSRVLGLSHSGTVRLVDRLERSGYVRRETGADGRSTLVTLTPAGRRAAERTTRARTEVLEGALSVLPARDRAALENILAQLLVGMMRGPGAVKWICRMCDTTTCRRNDGCPFANAARRLYSSSEESG